MQAAKRGNSLAAHLPAAVVKALGLTEGDDVRIQVLGAREMAVERGPDRERLPDRVDAFDGRLPMASSSNATTPCVADWVAIASDILVYAIAAGGTKRRRAKAAIARARIVTFQALNGTAHVVQRNAGMAPSGIEAALEVIRDMLRAVPIAGSTHVPAIEVVQETRYSIWNASILAASVEAGRGELTN